jgi:cyclic beta-1,2-glucan synthetase
MVTGFFRPDSLFVAAPILVLWAFANGISLWLNSPPRAPRQQLNTAEDTFLRQHALRIWRYFYEFGGARHNYLIPDNVEEEKLFEAARVSPTNFGLLLNARQAAVEFGFLTTPEFAELTRKSFATMAKLPKHLGHIFNWYNTHTLEPLLPASVSSVDSGNLAASLYTLRMGADALLHQPLLHPVLFRGLETHWQLLRLQKDVPAEIAKRTLPSENASLYEWCAWVFEAEQDPAFTAIPDYSEPSHDEASWWLNETRARLRNIASFLRNYMPWLLPEYASLRGMPQLGLGQDEETPTLENAADFAEQLEHRLARTWATLNTTESGSAQGMLVEQLRLELPAARQRLAELAADLRGIVDEAYRLAEDMDFAFLVAEGRQLLSIGYDLSTKKVHSAVYDMLASEARIATFIAVAKGDLSQQGWFKMARTHTMAFDHSILLSWTGTMFEYLMPALWMRTYPDTLIARALSAAVTIQREFARRRGIPWGISESGYAQKDDAGHYHYQAFGIPEISLKWDATAGPVISPYSTFLALEVEPAESLRNLHHMAARGWVGAYGFYEAADYAESTKEPGVVREWMAHHQGMALLAILNLLHDNTVQDWFHANPQFKATELLLHEKPIREAVLKAQHKEFATKKPSKRQDLKKAS